MGVLFTPGRASHREFAGAIRRREHGRRQGQLPRFLLQGHLQPAQGAVQLPLRHLQVLPLPLLLLLQEAQVRGRAGRRRCLPSGCNTLVPALASRNTQHTPPARSTACSIGAPDWESDCMCRHSTSILTRCIGGSYSRIEEGQARSSLALREQARQGVRQLCNALALTLATLPPSLLRRRRLLQQPTTSRRRRPGRRHLPQFRRGLRYWTRPQRRPRPFRRWR